MENENKKQTAVDWLMKELPNANRKLSIEETYNQAKKMDKKQTIDFARYCLDKAKDLDTVTSFLNVEQYYNDTFKQ